VKWKREVSEKEQTVTTHLLGQVDDQPLGHRDI
jgi:hypothetical protein